MRDLWEIRGFLWACYGGWQLERDVVRQPRPASLHFEQLIWNNEEAFVCSTSVPMSSVSSSSPPSFNLSVAELKVLLKLLGQVDYLAPLDQLKPSAKVARGELMAIAQSLQDKGLIDYRSLVERFAITQRGRMLFRLEMAARPVTPDEWLVMQSCRKGAIAVEQIAAKVPPSARQDLLQNLEQREFIKVTGRGVADVQLTQAGRAFLRSYRPSGSKAVLSLDLLTNYLNFMAMPLEPGLQCQSQPMEMLELA